MKWLLVAMVILTKSVTDGGTEKIGDVVDAQPIGIAVTEDKCRIAGTAMVAIFNREGKGSTLSVFNCIEITTEQALLIGEAQGMTFE